MDKDPQGGSHSASRRSPAAHTQLSQDMNIFREAYAMIVAATRQKQSPPQAQQWWNTSFFWHERCCPLTKDNSSLALILLPPGWKLRHWNSDCLLPECIQFQTANPSLKSTSKCPNSINLLLIPFLLSFLIAARSVNTSGVFLRGF